MPDFLLGTRALRNFIIGDPELHDWIDAQSDPTLHITYFSIASLLASAEAMANVTLRRDWVEKLTREIPGDFGPRVHGFDLAAARQWSAIRVSCGTILPSSSEDLQIAAVCLARSFQYVAPAQDWQSNVAQLVVHDPWS